MSAYYVTINGVTILTNKDTIAGWIEFALAKGGSVNIEKVEAA